MQVTKKTHPVKEGWLHITLELKPGVCPTAEEEKSLLCCGMPTANYDIAVCDRMGRKLRGAIRRKNYTHTCLTPSSIQDQASSI